MKLTVPFIVISPATHTWRSGWTLKKCHQCGTQTTGVVSSSLLKVKPKPLCSSCAVVKGFSR